MFQDHLLIEYAISLPVAMLVAYAISLVLRRIFGARLSLDLSLMVLTSLVGLSLGMFIAGWLVPGATLWMPTTLLLAFGCSIGLAFLVAGIVAGLKRDRDRVDAAALLAAGESERVEFKETARWNVRDDKKDARMEMAIAKTVAAFLNSRGGILVIGANDAGEAVGLERDFATLRVPDADRFELWLRDLLSTLLGRNAAALPRVEFSDVGGVEVCCVVCPRAPRPVFLTKAKDGTSTELWVRVGNSTRSFAVDEAVEYVARRWGGSRRRQQHVLPAPDAGTEG